MWRTKSRLPLWLSGALAGGASPLKVVRRSREEQAVLVTWERAGGHTQVPGGLDLPVLEERVERALRLSRVGELDGVQPGPGTLTLLAYGDDADRLWRALGPALRDVAPPPTTVTLRYGYVGAPDRTIRV